MEKQLTMTTSFPSPPAPILEICRILADRGHTIEFATLSGRQSLVDAHPFVKKVHFVGRAITPAEDERLYLRFSRWDNRSFAGRRDYIQCKKFYDSFWTETFRGLERVIRDAHPDLVFSDFQAEASRDAAVACCVPLAVMWPQMPWLLAPQPWVPGVPGTQTRCLTSEAPATMYDRLFEQSYFFRYAPHLIDLYLWTRKMRRREGVTTMPPMKPKPDHIVLVNSFFGMETPKDLPPLMMAAGPVLSPEWQPLDQSHLDFLRGKKSVLFFALGTHVILRYEVLKKLLTGLADAMSEGLVDGIVWAMRATARKQLAGASAEADDASATFLGLPLPKLLAGAHPSWVFLDHAPQRAFLKHESVKLFFTHSGPSSANEGLYHGVPMLAMPIFGDQINNAMRLERAGVGLRLEKHDFAAAEVTAKLRAILADADGSFARNVLRLQRIATVASRRKFAAADLIEEHMYDWGLRFEREVPLLEGGPPATEGGGGGGNGGRGRQLSPMHLETADMRMSWLRANNVDQLLILLAAASGLIFAYHFAWWW